MASNKTSDGTSAQVLGIHIGLLAVGFLSFALATSAHPPIDNAFISNANASSMSSTSPTAPPPTTFITSYTNPSSPSQDPTVTIATAPADPARRNLKIRGRNITEEKAPTLALEEKDSQEANEIASGQPDPVVKPAMEAASKQMIAVYVVSGILIVLLAFGVVWIIKRSRGR